MLRARVLELVPRRLSLRHRRVSLPLQLFNLAPQTRVTLQLTSRRRLPANLLHLELLSRVASDLIRAFLDVFGVALGPGQRQIRRERFGLLLRRRQLRVEVHEHRRGFGVRLLVRVRRHSLPCGVELRAHGVPTPGEFRLCVFLRLAELDPHGDELVFRVIPDVSEHRLELAASGALGVQLRRAQLQTLPGAVALERRAFRLGERGRRLLGSRRRRSRRLLELCSPVLRLPLRAFDARRRLVPRRFRRGERDVAIAFDRLQPRGRLGLVRAGDEEGLARSAGLVLRADDVVAAAFNLRLVALYIPRATVQLPANPLELIVNSPEPAIRGGRSSGRVLRLVPQVFHLGVFFSLGSLVTGDERVRLPLVIRSQGVQLGARLLHVPRRLRRASLGVFFPFDRGV